MTSKSRTKLDWQARDLYLTGTIKSLGTKLLASFMSNAAVRYTKSFLANAGNALADGTTYTAPIGFARAGTITGVWVNYGGLPAAGTNSFALKKVSGGVVGATILNAATIDPRGAAPTLAANTWVPIPLTAVAADLSLAALDGLQAVVIAGTQTTAAKQVELLIEFAPTDF